MGRHKADDNRQVFDVAKPGRSSPSPTSRPVIVDHQAIADDPMLSSSEEPTLMTHSAKAVMPISVSTDAEETSEPATPPEPAAKQPDNFFGNSSDASNPPENHPPVAPDTSPASFESFPLSPSTSGETPHNEDNQPKPPENATSSEESPLPAELTAPGADDPVGLSSSASANPMFSQTSANPTNPDNPKNDSAGLPPADGADPAAKPSEPTDQLPAVPENIGDIEQLPPPNHPHHTHFTPEPTSQKWLIPALILLAVAAYLIFDAGIIGSGKVPFEIFKQADEQVAEQPAPTPQQTSAPAAQLPAQSAPTDFTTFKLANTSLGFSYPSAWGKPTASEVPGYSKRSSSTQSDGIYAYLVDFENNKDVQVAWTSQKLLHPRFTNNYYDYLQWCTGTHDGKIYRQQLLFTTSAGVDTPTTITCADGPIENVTKLDQATILQPNAKDSANKPLGDIYSKNLSTTDFVVFRVKDSAMKSGEDIKKLLSTAQ